MGEKRKRTKAIWIILLMLTFLLVCIRGARAEAAGQDPSREREDKAVSHGTSEKEGSAELESPEAGDPAKGAGGERSQAEPSEDSAEEAKEQSRVTISLVGKYDSADTAVIYKIRPLEGTITFRNYETGRNYTLNYDPASHFIGVYEQEISGIPETGRSV